MSNPIDIQMLHIVVCSLTAIIIMALIAFAYVGGKAFSKPECNNGDFFGRIFSGGNFLRLATVVFCIVAVVDLACADKLTEGALAMLSAIAGFVLGGASKGSASPFAPRIGDS